MASGLKNIVECFAAPNLRRKFFALYEGFDHWPSSPIILVEDTTVPQFQTAINTFDRLIFEDPPPPKGATFSLKCICVGDPLHEFRNTNHQALTEICGTWYSGKHKGMLMERLINFFTEGCCVPIKYIYATYFGGDETTPPDEECKGILLKFLPSENVLSCTTKGSFWNVDGTGPCGPCSTFYYYCVLDDDYKYGHPRALIDQNHIFMPQICNFVFVKFTRDTNGVLGELPVEHVIAGMNFDAVKRHFGESPYLYFTDAFTPLLGIIHSYAGKGIQAYTSYVSPRDTHEPNVAAGIGRAYRIIADHLRMISVSTADGAQVGKHGRDTLLRFIDRHAIQLGIELLKIKNYSGLVEESIKVMANQFPEILPTDDESKQERLKQVVSGEVCIYHKTLAEIAYQEGSQKGAAGSRTPTTWYKTRPIMFFGLSTRIIHKFKDNKCPLVALCNVLLLGGKLSLGSGITEVSEGQLLHLVQNSLLRGNKKMELQNKLERSDQQKSVLDVLPRLPSSLPMIVKHNSVDGFGNNPQTTLFDYLGAPLYHGCLVDQGDEMPAQGGSKLTPRGLSQLRIELEEKEPSVLYWNDSFVTTVKVEGEMYLLLDDTSFVNEHTDMFWELLKAVNRGGLFMDCNFSPINLDPSFTILPLTKRERQNLKKKGKDNMDSGADKAKPLEKLQDSQTDILEEDSFYPIRLINFSGRQFGIIVQEKGGPCGIIAICNVLILRGEITLETTATRVHKDWLIERVHEYLKQGKGGLPYSQIPVEVLDVLPTLVSFVEVNLNFTRTDSFEESPSISLFRHLGIDLYHGWLPDPTDVTMASVLSHSFDTLSLAVLNPSFENAEQAITFLTGPQLTKYGLRCLRNDLKEDVLCVLFREKHCHTVIKIKGELYSLATAACLLGRPTVWDRLTEWGDESVDSNFTPIVGAANLDIKPFGGDESVDSNFMPIVGAAHLDMTPFDHPSLSSSKLSAQSDWQSVPSKRVSIRRAERPAVNVVIIDGVQTERAVSLEEFSSSGVDHFSESIVLFKYGTQVIVAKTLQIGRIIGSDLMDQIVQAHKTGRSWNGNFNKRSIQVSGGFLTALSAMITAALGEFSRGAMQNDYRTYVKEVLSLFEVKGVGYPAFFAPLITTLTKTDLPKLSHSSLQNFFRKILGNLALKCPHARAEYWGAIHRIRRNAPDPIKSDLRKVLTPPPAETDDNDEDWRQLIRASAHPLLKKTLMYTRKDATTSSNSKNDGKSSKQENDGQSSKQENDDQSSKQENDGKSSKQEENGNSLKLNDDEKAVQTKFDNDAVRPIEYGDFQNTIDSATQFPRQLNEHASNDSKVGPPINEPFENESELDLLYSRFIEVELARANDLLLTSNRLTHQLDDRLIEVFESLERREVFPPYAPRRWFSS